MFNIIKMDLQIFKYQCDNRCNSRKFSLINRRSVLIIIVTVSV
jgi:hypothetical protein